METVDLCGRPASSYLRFSSGKQEGGSTLARQQETLDRVLTHYRLVLDDSLIEKAMSASTGNHRKKGLLGGLLESVRRGEIARGTVLIVEAIDRLTREDFFDATDVVKDLIRGGIVLVTGDMTVWNAETLNSPIIHKLIAEIQAAKAYTDRLSEMSSGAHSARRKRLQSISDDQELLPALNGFPPGWIIRVGKPPDVTYRLHSKHTATLQLIFEMCLEGHSVVQIASYLNERKIPSFDGKTIWRGARIGTLLNDEKVLGYYQPRKRDGDKRLPVGNRVKLYPAAIDAEKWVLVRDQLSARRENLVGRKSHTVGNLFTHKIFCKSCGKSMRSIMSGRPSLTNYKLVCSTAIDSKTCTDRMRYDIHHFEPRILEILTAHAAPKLSTTEDSRKFAADHASLKIEITELTASLDYFAQKAGSSQSARDQVDRLTDQIAELTKQAGELSIRIQAAAAPVSRQTDVWEFLKELVMPAIMGDIEARDRLRSLLAKLDFKITGNADGGMIVNLADASDASRSHIIPPPERGKINRTDLLRDIKPDQDKRVVFGIAASKFMRKV